MNRSLEASYRFGLIGGIFCVLAFLVFQWSGIDPTNFSMIFGYVLIPVFVFIGIRFFRDKVNHGELSFAQGMTVGFIIYSIIAVLSGLGIYLILLVYPGLFEEIKASKITVIENNRQLIIDQLNEASFQVTYESVLEMTPADISFNDFIWKIIPGLFFTILISIILRKTKF
jgi:hypothetical protein